MFGAPTPVTIDLASVTPYQIGADPDRYLIVFSAPTGTCQVRPYGGTDGSGVGWNLTAGSVPLSFDFAHFGSLPGIPWTITTTDPACRLTYLVGRMVAPTLPDVLPIGVYRGRKGKGVSGRVDWRGGLGIRPQPAPLGGDHLPGHRR